MSELVRNIITGAAIIIVIVIASILNITIIIACVILGMSILLACIICYAVGDMFYLLKGLIHKDSNQS